MEEDRNVDSMQAACEIGSRLQAIGQEYAIGGAIALGFWGPMRATLDVDVTLFVPMERIDAAIDILLKLDFEFDTARASASFREHGFSKTAYRNIRVDVFLPLIDFYAQAKLRRARVSVGGADIMIWDAETLAVFKMMFFRQKDLSDVDLLLRARGNLFDRAWVRAMIVDIYGARDPRVSNWDDLVSQQEQ